MEFSSVVILAMIEVVSHLFYSCYYFSQFSYKINENRT